MNHLEKLFQEKSHNLLSLFFTAGYPDLSSTDRILKELIQQPVDMVEVGIPFSDPTADGPVIQRCSHIAIKNGITIERIFSDIKKTKEARNFPVLLMSYLNPILSYGIENFCRQCKLSGISGLIIPDLPYDYYEKHYAKLFSNFDLQNIPMIAPGSSNDRIANAAKSEASFIYTVSSKGTTGNAAWEENTLNYLKTIKQKVTPKPIVAGFGINSAARLSEVSSITNGAIVGSAFTEALTQDNPLKYNIETFIQNITRYDHSVK
jgi:tryptophan synthase alpha chain